MIELIPTALREHAAFAPYLPHIAQLAAARPEVFVGWAPRAHQTVAKHPIQQCRTTVGRGCPPYDDATSGNPHPNPLSIPRAGEGAIPTFTPPPARALSAIDFERYVVEQNELIVRPNNLHDVMNALVWLTFPKTKRAISAAHVALGVTADGKTRPRRRDVLTLFDEAGIIILSQRDELRHMHEAHQWRMLFVDHRQDFTATPARSCSATAHWSNWQATRIADSRSRRCGFPCRPIRQSQKQTATSPPRSMRIRC